MPFTGVYVLRARCDECGQEATTRAINFNSAAHELREGGWFLRLGPPGARGDTRCLCPKHTEVAKERAKSLGV